MPVPPFASAPVTAEFFRLSSFALLHDLSAVFAAVQCQFVSLAICADRTLRYTEHLRDFLVSVSFRAKVNEFLLLLIRHFHQPPSLYGHLEADLMGRFKIITQNCKTVL